MTVDVAAFRETLAQWASGVTIVTSAHAGARAGITASSFTSVGIAPPRILVCVAKRLYTHELIAGSGSFAVNILTREQQAWGMRFAGQMPEREDRFFDMAVTTAVTGAPILPAVLGWLDCRVHQAHDGGDHTIFVGDVVACCAAPAGSPILYYHRNWHQLDGTPVA